MSKKSNVHPDHQDVIQEVERQKFREQEAFLEKQAGRRNPVSRDTMSGQQNNREREHVNDQPPQASAERTPTRARRRRSCAPRGEYREQGQAGLRAIL
jgi:hypothetical protein